LGKQLGITKLGSDPLPYLNKQASRFI